MRFLKTTHRMITTLHQILLQTSSKSSLDRVFRIRFCRTKHNFLLKIKIMRKKMRNKNLSPQIQPLQNLSIHPLQKESLRSTISSHRLKWWKMAAIRHYKVPCHPSSLENSNLTKNPRNWRITSTLKKNTYAIKKGSRWTFPKRMQAQK